MIRLFLRGLMGLLVLLVLVVSQTSAARADLNIVIDNGNREPLPIAIPRFYGANPHSTQLGQDIAKVVSADLERSGLFRPIDPAAFIQTVESLQIQPRFADWRVINAQALVQGKAEIMPDGMLRVEFRLWDVAGEAQMVGQAYSAGQVGWRRLAHKIADAIYERLTGEQGYFDTQMIYIAESGPWNKRVRKLALMDQDGENHTYLTNGADMVLTPRFSPNQREIAYLSYYNDTPRVYIFHLDTNRREILGDFPDMTFAPRFSPDGNKVIMSLMQGGNSDIYVMDLRSRHVTQLTNHPAIDTSPCYSPDGAKIVFNSDRAGSQQLYVMDADGSNQTRISFGDGRYATPVWSPRGDLIAFTKMKGGEFFIGVMRPDGSGERLLTRGFLVEGPTWAPNGRVLAYWKQMPSDSSGHSTSRLYTIDLTGFNERQMVTPQDASAPAWSPLIP